MLLIKIVLLLYQCHIDLWLKSHNDPAFLKILGSYIIIIIYWHKQSDFIICQWILMDGVEVHYS